MTDVITFYFYCMDGDYTPQAFGTEHFLIDEGDNIHRTDLVHKADGYATAKDAIVNRIEICTADDLLEHENRLKNYGVYEDFAWLILGGE